MRVITGNHREDCNQRLSRTKKALKESSEGKLPGISLQKTKVLDIKKQDVNKQSFIDRLHRNLN